MMAFDEYIDKVREGKPILFNGRTFNQLKVRQLGVYHLARQSFELMQSSLPPKFARYSWCECLDALDVDAKAELKRALQEYKGSLLMVCHEPDFYEGLATDVWDCTKWTTKVF